MTKYSKEPKKNLDINVFKEYTSVSEFLITTFGNERKIVGGLLDYGYTPNEITTMGSLSISRVSVIMDKNKFNKVKS